MSATALAAALPPLVLAEFDRPLPPLVVGTGEDARTIALRPIPVSAVERLQPIEQAHGTGSWAYMREVLRAGAPGLSDAELDGLSVTQATVLATVLLHGVERALKAIDQLREDASPDGAPGEGSAGEATSPSSATSAP